jgi:hypothetical protein
MIENRIYFAAAATMGAEDHQKLYRQILSYRLVVRGALAKVKLAATYNQTFKKPFLLLY